MSRRLLVAFMLVSGLIVLGLSGCSSSTSEETAANNRGETDGPPVADDGRHEHAHPSGGPHGGSLIELGNEEYHAELVHDEQSGSVTVYLLDSAAKAAVPIEAAEVAINIKHDGRGEQFKLTASADNADPQGKSSRFVSTDTELTKELDHEHVEAQLAMTINGKPYRGAIEHHGHDEHAREHVEE